MSNGFFFFIFRSFNFSGECLGQHDGAFQAANLGDGNNYGQNLLTVFFRSLTDLVMLTVNETSEVRYNYGDPQLGACRETIQGGDHLRYWEQNGPQGNRYGFKFGLFCLSTGDLICLLSLAALFLWPCHMRSP